jgi:hypothetical protein
MGAVLCIYSDSSRERTQSRFSGFCAWTIVSNTLLLVVGQWTAWEVEAFTINVTEFVAEDLGLFTIIRHVGCQVRYVVSFVDNEAAEGASNSLASSAPIFQALTLRRQRFHELTGVHARSERITSKNNLWADWGSRGDEAKIRAAAERKGLDVITLEPCSTERDMSWLMEHLEEQRADAANVRRQGVPPATRARSRAHARTRKRKNVFRVVCSPALMK